MVNILDQLRKDIQKNLTFHFRNFKNQRGDYDPRVGDFVNFDIYAFNQNQVDLKHLLGVITKGGATSFVPVPFSVHSVPANKEVLVKVFKDIEITDNPDDIKRGLNIMDSIANIKVDWEAELSPMKIKDDKKILFKRVQYSQN